jgi:hypothetical protein
MLRNLQSLSPEGAFGGRKGTSNFLPDCWGEHSLELSYSSIYGNQELYVVESHSSGHCVCVVLVVYAQVSACRLTSPVHCQVQRCGLNALGRHLTKGQKRKHLRLNHSSEIQPEAMIISHRNHLRYQNVTILFVQLTNELSVKAP